MNIQNYLSELLLFSQKVVLPGFGSLKIIKKSAILTGNKIVPPKSELIFDAIETMDDTILSTQISKAEDISIEEARQKVLELIDEIKFSLDKGEGYVIPELGTIKRDVDNKLSIEKDINLILDPENFGLESFELDDFQEDLSELIEEGRIEKKKAEILTEKPLETNINQQSPLDTESTEKPAHSKIADKTSAPAPHPVRKNNRSTVWFVMGSVVVLMAAIIIIALQTNLVDNKMDFDSFFENQDMHIEDDFSKSEDGEFNFDELVNEFEKDINSVTTIKNAMKPVIGAGEQVMAASKSEYHIIAGSFKDSKNAEDLQKELVFKGYPALTIDLGNGIYRVSAISFTNKNQALNALIAFRESMNLSEAWLMSLE